MAGPSKGANRLIAIVKDQIIYPTPLHMDMYSLLYEKTRQSKYSASVEMHIKMKSQT